MTGRLVRLALLASWAGGRLDRQRTIVISLSAAAVTVIVCGVASTYLMAERVIDRSTARSFLPTVGDEPPALKRHTIFDVAPDGEQIYVYWWHLIDPDVHVPGVPEKPRPNSWFVSPALGERVGKDPTLGERFPNAETIGAAGVGNPEELVAYRFVGPDVYLPEPYSARVGPDAWIGETADVQALSIVRTALVLIAIPVLGLLLAAMSPEATALERRLGLLHALGASRSVRSMLVFVQAALSALPGALVAGAAWLVLSPRLTSVPIVGRRVLAGDLRLPIGIAVAAVVGVGMLAGLVAVIRPRSSASNRPSERVVQPPTALRTLLLAAGLAMMMAGSGAFGQPSDRTFMAGLLASSVGVVIALPFLFTRAGHTLAEGPGVLSMLVGRRLSWNASAASRSLLTLGALAAVTPVAAAWIALQRVHLQDPVNPAVVQLVGIGGPLAPDELDSLRERTGATVVEVARDARGQTSGSLDPPEVLIGDCRALVGLIELSRCDDDGFTLSPASTPAFARYQASDGFRTRQEGFEVVATLFLSSDPQTTDGIVRAHVNNRAQPWFSAIPFNNPLHESPLIRWVLGGLSVGVLVSGAALALQVFAQSTSLATSRVRLRYVGADTRTIRRLASAESVLTVGLAGLACTAVGAIGSWFFVQMNPDAKPPYEVITFVAACVISAAMLGGAAAWFAINGRVGSTGD